MKSHLTTDCSQNRAPHLAYNAFCLAGRDRTTPFSERKKALSDLLAAALTCPRQRSNSYRPVKQKRALLESNPPRDSWIERRRNKTVSTFGEAKTSPKARQPWRPLFQSPEHASQTHPKPVSKSSKSFRGGHQQPKTLGKTTLARTRFFEASPVHSLPSL